MIFAALGLLVKVGSRTWQYFRNSEVAVGILLASIVGLLAGLATVGFRKLIQAFEWVFFVEGADVLDFLGDNYVVVLPVAGALLFAPIVYFLAREAGGEGPPEVMEAVIRRGGRIRGRVAVVKALATSICIGSGGSVGREGPIVQIGASIGSSVGRVFRLTEGWTKTMVLCGAAGGVAATFNAPIGGVLFALEVLQRRFVPGNLVSLVISAVAADAVALGILGEAPAFILPDYKMVSEWEVLPYILLGIAMGLAAFGFVKFFYKVEDLFGALKIPSYVKPAIGGLIVGLIAIEYHQVMGTGYGEGYTVGGLFRSVGATDTALLGGYALLMLIALALLKMVATSATLGSGGTGGIFAPSLFIGAMFGGAFGILVARVAPGISGPTESFTSASYALVGMAAFFSATTHAPITSIVMLFEMTRNYGLILPLMTAVIFSTLVAKSLSRESIYTMRLARRGVDVHRQEHADLLNLVKVRDVMTPDFPTVLASTPVSRLIEEFHREGHHGFPMVDEAGRFVGVVTLEDVERVMPRLYAGLTAADIATRSPIVAYPDQSIHDAIEQLGGRDIGRIPVVDPADPKKLLGVLRRHDIIRGYTHALETARSPDKSVRKSNLV